MKRASLEDIGIITDMLYSMYQEVNPDLAVKNKEPYQSLANKHLATDDVWLDEEKKGMFIMRDESLDVLNIKIWNGVSVYIKPEFRKTNVLKRFYDFMFDNYEGTIMGYTDVNSEHNMVLKKRHKLLGRVYELNR